MPVLGSESRSFSDSLISIDYARGSHLPIRSYFTIATSAGTADPDSSTRVAADRHTSDDANCARCSHRVLIARLIVIRTDSIN